MRGGGQGWRAPSHCTLQTCWGWMHENKFHSEQKRILLFNRKIGLHNHTICIPPNPSPLNYFSQQSPPAKSEQQRLRVTTLQLKGQLGSGQAHCKWPHGLSGWTASQWLRRSSEPNEPASSCNSRQGILQASSQVLKGAGRNASLVLQFLEGLLLKNRGKVNRLYTS